jgi:two-component system response regulator YesN
VTLAALADKVHLNPSYLSRLYKQETGVKLSEYVAEIRIRKAKSMLEEEGTRIHEIAAALGYGTAANFTRFFKRFANQTPQEFRERLSRQ